MTSTTSLTHKIQAQTKKSITNRNNGGSDDDDDDGGNDRDDPVE